MRPTKPDQPEIFLAKNGEYCWRVRNGSNKKITAVGGETFKTRHGATKAYKSYHIRFDTMAHLAPLNVNK